MKKITFFLVSIVISLFTNAQVTFEKTYGGNLDDYAESVQQTSDNGYIICGYTNSYTSGYNDVYLIKTDSTGNYLWWKVYGFVEYDFGHSVQQTSDNGYIICGSTTSYGAGSSDVYLIKTDVNGDTLWTKTFGGLNTDDGFSVKQTNDNGYIITGSTASFGSGNFDVYLIKTDVNGNTQWNRTFGGTLNDIGRSVQQTNDNGYVITGFTKSFSSGKYDVYLIKTDVNGDTLWTKNFGGAEDDLGYSVRQTFDNGYIITGYTASIGSGDDDVYLIKTDVNGDTLWTKTFGGLSKERAFSVQQTSDSTYIITGYTASFGSGDDDVYLIKTDMSGIEQWTETFGGTNKDCGFSVQQTSDYGYIITGFTESFGTLLGSNVYLIKTNGNGILTSINDIKPLNKLNIYPNPCNGIFNIVFTNGLNGLEIFNLNCQSIYKKQFNQTDNYINKIDISNFSKGIYFMKVQSKNTSTVEKIVIQ